MLRRKPPAGRDITDRDRIALGLLKRAREGSPNVAAVWYSGGAAIQIKRSAIDLYPVSITWREAHRLAFPEEYIESVEYAKPGVPRKGIARFQGERKNRTIAL